MTTWASFWAKAVYTCLLLFGMDLRYSLLLYTCEPACVKSHLRKLMDFYPQFSRTCTFVVDLAIIHTKGKLVSPKFSYFFSNLPGWLQFDPCLHMLFLGPLTWKKFGRSWVRKLRRNLKRTTTEMGITFLGTGTLDGTAFMWRVWEILKIYIYKEVYMGMYLKKPAGPK